MKYILKSKTYNIYLTSIPAINNEIITKNNIKKLVVE